VRFYDIFGLVWPVFTKFEIFLKQVDQKLKAFLSLTTRNGMLYSRVLGIWRLCLHRLKRTSSFVCLKSRVAPLKTLTVPKLELCGAELLFRLIAKVSGTNVFDGKVYCWCESAVGLSWFRDGLCRLNIFIANQAVAHLRVN